MSYLRPVTRLLTTALLLAQCIGYGWAEEKPQPDKDELAYGVALYHFFQDRYFSAISDLLIARKRNEQPELSEEPELLLGGLYLSYGLYADADERFRKLIADNATPEVQDRAWFSLARMYYLRGMDTEAMQALTRIGDTLPDFREAERLNLLANIHLRQANYASAIDTLKAFRGDSTWETYARFNLGVALVRHGDPEDGFKLLEDAGDIKPGDDELAALKDKANLALGYALLREERPEEATEAFKRVRLEGSQSSKALLGIGWALSTLDNYEYSLVPWTELKDRSPLDPAVQESLLAIPYTFEKLDRSRLALASYDRATGIYARQLAELDQIAKAIDEGELIRAIQPGNLGDETAYSSFRSKLPDSITAPYLREMLASHDFQTAMKDYQDLLYLKYNLGRWAESLPNFDLMLQERRKLYAEKLPRIAADEQLRNIEALAKQRDTLADEIQRIENSNDVLALANEEELDHIEVLDDVSERLKGLAGQRDLSSQDEKYAFLQGVLYWQIAEDIVPRQWALKKELKGLDEALKEARAAETSLKQTWAEAPATFEGFEARIQGQMQRIDKLQRSVNTASDQHAEYINNLARSAINQQRRRLETYQLRARFAVARLYDVLAKEGEQ
jgi:hypothetical protein